MELEKILDSLRNGKTLYIVAGILVLVVLAIALQDVSQPSEGDEKIRVALNIDTEGEWKSSNVTVRDNTSVFDALNSTYDVEYTEYSTGYFVTSIDGTSQSGSHSWIYFVNSAPAEKAVDRYYLSEGDNVTFRYLHNNETAQYFSE